MEEEYVSVKDLPKLVGESFCTVCFDAQQNLTEEQRQQARENIGAAAIGVCGAALGITLPECPA